MRGIPRHVAAIALVWLGGVALAAGPTTAPTTRPSIGAVKSTSSFRDTRLDDCLDYLRDVSGANIQVDWKALEQAGINRDTPVTINLESVTLRRALTLVLKSATGNRAVFTIDENVIAITTRQNADKTLITLTHDVSDLVMTVPDFEAPDISLRPSGGAATPRAREKEPTQAERGENLVKIIVETVCPEVWKDNGGPASIRYMGGKLIVTAPRYVHDAIAGTLK